ncbi:DUF6950 family protein [Sphingomonas sp. Leaf10]|uniref:DUF6950 family protein n=1 Tax=Sphingomonas sp. Leaf10 TaxID=1735676 RepID=UPI0006F3DC3D|nr:hypothetical protein [Sphingomonas sp. Leaf10]KQM37659.1 hypothetical protein ASE59_14100 [Sphingomonas sp. Leaf10]
MNLHDRAVATAVVVDRFRRRPFGWNGGTCIHLARAQMRAMGHRPPSIPRFQSAVGARRALAATGHEDIGSLLDTMLPRIVPAQMWVGDLAMVPSEDGLGALAVADGGGTLFMYHAGAEWLANVKDAMTDVVAAWRL